MKRSAVFFSLLLVAMLLAGASRLHAAAEEKKVIYHGWDTRDSAYVAGHWQEMEQMPFDGIGIGIALDRSRPTIGDGSTGNLLGWQIFGPAAFHSESFRGAVADLKTPEWKRFTDNFLPLAIATRDQDQGLSWFDDARWRTIENNWRVLLTIAREGRCRGILLDPEHYDYECELFNYGHHRAQRGDRTFDEYAVAARARGRQLGAAVREAFPDITIGLLYGYALAAGELRDGQPLGASRYALLPAFFDGLIEASAPGAKFVDLWESGHGYKLPKQFLQARDKIKNPPLGITSNLRAYQASMSAGMSLRLDYQLPGIRWQTGNPDGNYFSPAHFERALRGALEAADRYVWIYSEENPRFFPPAGLPAQYLEAIGAARHPAAPAAPASAAVPISVGLAGMLGLGIWLRMKRARRRAEATPFGAPPRSALTRSPSSPHSHDLASAADGTWRKTAEQRNDL